LTKVKLAAKLSGLLLREKSADFFLYAWIIEAIC